MTFAGIDVAYVNNLVPYKAGCCVVRLVRYRGSYRENVASSYRGGVAITDTDCVGPFIVNSKDNFFFFSLNRVSDAISSQFIISR